MNNSLSLAQLRIIVLITILIFIIGFSINKKNELPKAKHIILIGIDGLTVEGLQFAHTPNINRLINEGAVSLQARAVFPTISAPNWTSILTGVGPEQHGITLNKGLHDPHTITPILKDEDGFFPSIFNIIRDQIPNAETAIYHDWTYLENLINKSKVNKFEFSDNYELSFTKAISYFLKQEPVFTFIYIGEVDHVGHESRFGSAKYLKEIEKVDYQIGLLMDELIQAEKMDEIYIIITSDHGGFGQNHSGESIIEIEVPWIIYGPGIIRNKLINQSLNTMDTMPTIAYLLQLKLPHECIGRPVLSAFEINSHEDTHSYIAAPHITPSPSQIFVNKTIKCILSSDTEGVSIHYTTDNSEPTINSPFYEGPIFISESLHINAKAFDNKNNSSSTIHAYYNILQSKDGTATGKIYKR